MAIDTAITAQNGAAGIPGKLLKFQRDINFADNNLTSGDHFALFNTPPNALVLSGQVEILISGTATTDVTIGVDAGTELLTGANLDGAVGTVTAFTNTVGVSFDSAAIDLAVDTATAILGKVRVTVYAVSCDKF